MNWPVGPRAGMMIEVILMLAMMAAIMAMATRMPRTTMSLVLASRMPGPSISMVMVTMPGDQTTMAPALTTQMPIRMPIHDGGHAGHAGDHGLHDLHRLDGLDGLDDGDHPGRRRDGDGQAGPGS